MRRRPLRLIDLMTLVVAVALTLVSPTIVKALIPVAFHHNWSRRLYVDLVSALVMIWWTVALVLLLPSRGGPGRRRVFLGYGNAAIVAAAVTVLFLAVRQIPVILLYAMKPVPGPYGLFKSQVFVILEHAPDASASAIVAAWTILGLTGTGRHPSNWFERLGCLVGWIWIVLAFLNLIVMNAPIPWLTRNGIN